MIKRIIFDLDNTLIPWNDKYYISFNNALDKLSYKYNDDLILKLIDAINDYENKFDIYDREKLRSLMSNYSNQELPAVFIDMWLDELCLCYEKPSDELIDTLEYLSHKYDLVILTNWFAHSQLGRLKNADIHKYFSDVFCADSFLMKPNKESYSIAAGPYNPSECVMIGDSLKCDIHGASDAGMNVIYYNYNDKDSDGYPSISKFIELKEKL